MIDIDAIMKVVEEGWTVSNKKAMALCDEVKRLRSEALVYLPDSEKSGISCVEPMKCMKHMQNIEAELQHLRKENETLRSGNGSTCPTG